MYGNQALRIRNLGEDAASAGRYVQGNRTRKRLFPFTYPEIIPQPRSGTRGRLCQRVCRSNALSSEERPEWRRRSGRPRRKAGRGAHHPSHFGNYHWNTYKNWINSYRDLPILCNQWANVFRWEMRTRLFLRTAEFLWQEGHTAHATREEAEEEAVRMLNVYGEFAEKYMAVPVVKGVKSANERFAGALNTYTIEAMMQDGKALQSGTSHFLGQNFAKAFDVQFVNKENKLEYVWATSWGVSTRLMGALIMTHSDDNGLVLPPHLAPIQVVIVPIYKNAEMLAKIDEKIAGIVAKLKSMGISVKYDNADNKRPGFKFADYEVKGVPVRLVMGGRDLENNTMEVMRRDTLEKETRSCDGIEEYVKDLLEEIQANIYKKALDYRNSRITVVDSYDEFKEKIEEGGFILAHWDGTTETEEKVKEETKATIRCIPFESFVPGDKEPGKCMVTGKPSACRVIFARSY